MASKQIVPHAKFVATHSGIAMVVLFFVILPICLTLISSVLSNPRPSGFGQDPNALLQLAATSLGVSLTASAIALLLAVTASSMTLGSIVFHSAYRIWLIVMLFTNPIFLVLGFSTLLSHTTPIIAVITATSYVVLPLGGLIVQSGFNQYPYSELYAARALGAGIPTIVFSNILPRVQGQIQLALLLMTVYAIGFFLLPTYVGFGWVVTLGTAINTAANRVGDWEAAQQLATITLLVQCILIGIWWLIHRIYSRVSP